MEDQTHTQEKQVTIIKSEKSMGLTILLTALLGPVGMFYSTITGGIVMLVVNIVIAIFTLGFGLLLTWPICIVWAAVATNNHNKKLLQA